MPAGNPELEAAQQSIPAVKIYQRQNNKIIGNFKKAKNGF